MGGWGRGVDDGVRRAKVLCVYTSYATAQVVGVFGRWRNDNNYIVMVFIIFTSSGWSARAKTERGTIKRIMMNNLITLSTFPPPPPITFELFTTRLRYNNDRRYRQ